jgi:hypothetical protein
VKIVALEQRTLATACATSWEDAEHFKDDLTLVRSTAKTFGVTYTLDITTDARPGEYVVCMRLLMPGGLDTGRPAAGTGSGTYTSASLFVRCSRTCTIGSSSKFHKYDAGLWAASGLWSGRAGQTVELTLTGAAAGALVTVENATLAGGACSKPYLSTVKSTVTISADMLSIEAITAEMTLTLTEASLDRMRANPNEAKAGLAAGIAATITGVDAEQVTIVSTTPDLFGRRLAPERLLAGVDLKVEFAVQSTTLTAASLAKAVENVDSTALTTALTTALEAQGIAVVITGIQVKVIGDEACEQVCAVYEDELLLFADGEEGYGYEEYAYDRRLEGREDPLCEQIRGDAVEDVCAAFQSGGWACEDSWAAKCLGDHPAGAAYNSITIRQGGACPELCPAGSGDGYGYDAYGYDADADDAKPRERPCAKWVCKDAMLRKEREERESEAAEDEDAYGYDDESEAAGDAETEMWNGQEYYICRSPEANCQCTKEKTDQPDCGGPAEAGCWQETSREVCVGEGDRWLPDGRRLMEGKKRGPAQRARARRLAKSDVVVATLSVPLPEETYAAGTYTVCYCVSPPCGAPERQFAGLLAVTARADLGKTFVLEGGEGSIEVTGKNLQGKRDRLLLAGCQDTCGATNGTKEMSSVPGLLGLSPVDWAAEAFAFEFGRMSELGASGAHHFTEVVERRCEDTPLLADAASRRRVGPAGPEAFAEANRCAVKCAADPMALNCKGFQDDSEDSLALCLPRSECLRLCSALPGCAAVNIVTGGERCELQSRACGQMTHAGTQRLATDPRYSLLLKESDIYYYYQGDDYGDGESFSYSYSNEFGIPAAPWNLAELCSPELCPDPMAESCMACADACSPGVVCVTDSEVAQDLLDLCSGYEPCADVMGVEMGSRRLQAVATETDVLRFAPVQLDAGKYKVCFCDAEISSDCSAASDFSVEVGTVHVSGVACLLDEPRLRHATCYSQHFGGLSCGSSDAPSPAQPEGLSGWDVLDL